MAHPHPHQSAGNGTGKQPLPLAGVKVVELGTLIAATGLALTATLAMKQDIADRETHWKQVPLSRSHGYNRN